MAGRHGYSITGFAAFLLSLIATSAAAQAAGFAFDPERCTFGPELDAAFADLQKEHDREAAAAGFRFKMPNAELSESTGVHRKLDLALGSLTVSAIGVSFYDVRAVYFADFETHAIAGLKAMGVRFEDDEGSGIADNSWVFGTEDGAWNEATQKTELVYSEFGKSALSCTLPVFRRMANEAGMTVEELAKLRLDPAIWAPQIAELHKRAIAAQEQSDFDAAAKATEELVSLLDAAGTAGSFEYAHALDAHAASLSGQGRKREALALLERAVNLSADIIGPKHLQTTRILLHYGEAMNAVRPQDEAWWLINAAYFEYMDLLGDDSPEAIAALDVLGVATRDIVMAGREQMLDLEDAADKLKRALDNNRKRYGEEDLRTLDSLYNHALVLKAMGDIPRAGEEMHRVVQDRYKALGAEHPETIRAIASEVDLRLRVEHLKAKALVPARLVARSFSERRNRMAGNPRDEAQREREEAEQRKAFLDFANAAWWGAEAEPDKRARARAETFLALQDAMAGAAERDVARMAARKAAARSGAELGELAARRQQLSDRWRQVEALLTRSLADSSPDAAARRKALRQEQQAIDAEGKQIDARLAKDAPDYFAFTRPQPLSIAETREMLARDEAILIVVPTEFGTHVMAVTHDGIEWQRSDWTRGEVNEAVKRLLWDVGANIEVTPEESDAWMAEGEGAYPFDRTTAFKIYSQVVAPVAGTLAGKRHVFTAALGSLSSLPFGLLVTEAPTGADGDPAMLRATQWFADAHALVQIPSVQSLQLLRRSAGPKHGRTSQEFMGFGDPVLQGQAEQRGGGGSTRRQRPGTARAGNYFRTASDASGSGTANVEALRGLARLPGTAREIASLGKAFGAGPDRMFLGARATEGALKAQDLSGTRILALATHGLVSGEVDGNAEPGLVLTPPAQASAEDDGLLSASEVAGLDLGAEWVILSACNTAVGDGSEGAPGLSSLARSFFFAGASNLLASHWPVLDDVAPRITVRTVELQRDNPAMSRAEAFQEAIREIREDASKDSASDTLAHPSAWAPFTLIGDR